MSVIRSKVSTLMIFSLGVFVACALAILAYLQLPLFGKMPQGARLELIAQSPNQAAGTFRNLIDTPLLTTDESQLSLWLSNFDKRGNVLPPASIPTIKTDLKALDVSQDLVVWLGHSSYFLQLNGQRILVDPVLSTNAAPVPGANVAFEGSNLYMADDIPEIDILLISHDHYDHLDYPTIRALQPKIKQVVTGLGVGAHFDAWGYDTRRVHEADWYDTFRGKSDLQIHVTPARHFSGRALTRDRTQWVGFALTTSQHRIFFSGDSGYAPHFAEIGRRYGPFDWVALDTGQYNPHWANVHMNPEQAAQAAEDLNTRILTPGHIGRFAIAPHNWDDPFKRIAAASRQRDYALWTPMIGDPVFLDGRPQAFSSWWEAVRSP